MVVPGHGEVVYQSLRDLEGSAVTLELLQLGETYKGTIEAVRNRILSPVTYGSITSISEIVFSGERV